MLTSREKIFCRGLLGVEDSVHAETESLHCYMSNSEVIALKAVTEEHTLKRSVEFPDTNVLRREKKKAFKKYRFTNNPSKPTKG